MNYVLVILVTAFFLMLCIFLNQWKQHSGDYSHAFSRFFDMLIQQPWLSLRIYLALCIFSGFIVLVEAFIRWVISAM